MLCHSFNWTELSMFALDMNTMSRRYRPQRCLEKAHLSRTSSKLFSKSKCMAKLSPFAGQPSPASFYCCAGPCPALTGPVVSPAPSFPLRLCVDCKIYRPNAATAVFKHLQYDLMQSASWSLPISEASSMPFDLSPSASCNHFINLHSF